MGGATNGTSKTLAKLEKSVRSGSFYEAQQMYKSVSARYLASGKFEDAMGLLESGACLQLEHDQVNCGVELGNLLVESMSKSSQPFSEKLLGRLQAVFQAFTKEGGPGDSGTAPSDDGAGGEGQRRSAGGGAGLPASASEGRGEGKAEGTPGPWRPSQEAIEGAKEFLKSALRWSMRVEGGARMGAPELHDCMAKCYWQYAAHKDMAMAAQHFVLGTSPLAFASALLEIMDECFPDELDLVAARAAFQYLSTGNLRGANAVLELLQAPPPDLLAGRQDPPEALPDSPLMHFLAFLLLTLERDALPLFRMLRTHYSPSLDRDPSFETYLDEIAHKFYGVRKQQGGFLGELMQMLMSPEN